MRPVRLFVVLLVFGWSSGAGAVPIQWTVAEGGNGHFYEAVDLGIEVSWDDAKSAAEAAGGYLATITSAEEDDWVTANLLPLISGTRGDGAIGPWIGGYQDLSSPAYAEPSGGWVWITGEPWDYTAWYPNEPNNGGSNGEKYLHYYVSHLSGWNDNSHTPDSYIIETVPEPSTALLLGIGLAGIAMRKRR